MNGPFWISNQLFVGRIVIGRVCRSKVAGMWLGFSYLPGAQYLIGRDFESETAAQEAVLKSAQSRCKAMFGAGLQTTSDAVNEGRKLRVTARAIWRAGVWRCDRPVNAKAMFADLAQALKLDPTEAPKPAETPNPTGSTAEAPPDDGEFLEDFEDEIGEMRNG